MQMSQHMENNTSTQNLFYSAFYDGLIPCEKTAYETPRAGWPLGRTTIKVLKGKGSLKKGDIFIVDSRHIVVKNGRNTKIFFPPC